MPRSLRGSRNDPVLLLEAGLIVLLIGLFIFLYILPSAESLADVPWWAPILLGGLLFAVLLIDAWRRRRRYRRSINEMLEHHLGHPPDDDND